MKRTADNNVQPLRMLPRFDPHAFVSESHLSRISESNGTYQYKVLSEGTPSFLLSQTVSQPQLARLLLPRFRSDHRSHSYDENQSAEATLRTTSQTKLRATESQQATFRPNKFDIKFLERAYDQSGKKCWPAVIPNTVKFDLEYAYEIVGDTVESYMRYRKLDRCKALSNFIEYRNTVYKREKIAQYAPPPTKTRVKETVNGTPKAIRIEEDPSLSVSPSPSTASENFASSPSASSTPSPNRSPQLSKEALIPIPSPELLKSSTPKSSRPVTPSKQSNLLVPKKTNSNFKQPPSSPTKGSPQSKPNVTFKSKTIPKKVLTKNRNQTKTSNKKQKSCAIL